jgi:hypothetical protein
MCSLATQFTRSGVLLAVLIAGEPAAAQTLPPSDASVPSTASNPRVVVHVYVEPSFNWMAEWHARNDALQADASASHLPVSDDVTERLRGGGEARYSFASRHVSSLAVNWARFRIKIALP